MLAMQVFHTKLSQETDPCDPYWRALAQLRQAGPSRLTVLDEVPGWDPWQAQ